MRRSVVLVLGSVATTWCAAVAAASPGSWTETSVERFGAGDRRLVVSMRPGSPSLAVCRADAGDTTARWGPVAATPAGSGAVPDPPREIEARRARLTDATVGGVHVACVESLADELAWAMDFVAHGSSLRRAPSDGADASVTESAEARVTTLALEGETPGAGLPSSVVAVVSGASPRDVEAVAARVLGPLSPCPGAGAPLAVSQSSERFSFSEGPVSVPLTRFGWLVPRGSAQHEAALDFAVDVLGARLSVLLVRERSLARRAAAWTRFVGGGEVVGGGVEISSRTTLDRARRYADGAVLALRLKGPSRREMDRARARLTLSAVTDWEDPLRRARRLAIAELVSGDANGWLAEAGALYTMKADAVRALAHDVFVETRRCTDEVFPPHTPEDDPRLAHHMLYTVEHGDTLAAVAARYHVEPAAVARANDLDPSQPLVPGQPLWIPPP
jgi:hypothetical protein